MKQTTTGGDRLMLGHPVVVFTICINTRLLVVDIDALQSRVTKRQKGSRTYIIAGRPGGVSGYPRAWYRSVS